jgi:hypothetical protein
MMAARLMMELKMPVKRDDEVMMIDTREKKVRDVVSFFRFARAASHSNSNFDVMERYVRKL